MSLARSGLNLTMKPNRLARLRKQLNDSRYKEWWKERRLPYAWELADLFHEFVLPIPDMPAALTLDEWETWRKETTKKHPIRYFLHHTFSIEVTVWARRLFKDPYWWIRHRISPAHRYHIIDTGLTPGYYDPDHRILFGIMNMVEKYVEYTADKTDWTSDPGHEYAWKVMTEAAEWWKENKENFSNGRINLTHEEESRLEDEADDHLACLMRVRQYLWYP